MSSLNVRFGRLFELCSSLKNLSCYASTSNVKQESLPPGFRRTPPFGLFLKENYVKKDGVKVTEVMSELQKRWNSLDALEKKKYFDASEAEKQAKKAKFDALSVEEKEKLREEAQKRREDRKQRRIRAERAAKREESNRPVRPSSAYNLYMKEKMGAAERTPEQQRGKFKEYANAWKTLSETEKQKYVNEANQLAKKFEAEMATWKLNNEKMKETKKAQEKMHP